jgi:hypothetical protein
MDNNIAGVITLCVLFIVIGAVKCYCYWLDKGNNKDDMRNKQ